MKLETISKEYRGYKMLISIHHDEDTGAPWEENDGHGIVSEWTTRDKQPGELVLGSERRSRRYYDFAATLKLARRDGWGLSDNDIAKLAKQLGRKPTAKQILNESVIRDFEYLRGWCQDDWQWLGYTSEIETPDGETIDGDSCWGFEGTDDGTKYMIGEAESHCRSKINSMIEAASKEQSESHLCACADIATV